MSEKEPPTSRYTDFEEYQPTIPGSIEAWKKAAAYLNRFLSNLPEDPLPDETYVFYTDEPKAIIFDFIAGKFTEADIQITLVDEKPEHIFSPTETSAQFEPADTQEERLQRLVSLHQAICSMLENDPPKTDSKTQ